MAGCLVWRYVCRRPNIQLETTLSLPTIVGWHEQYNLIQSNDVVIFWIRQSHTLHLPRSTYSAASMFCNMNFGSGVFKWVIQNQVFNVLRNSSVQKSYEIIDSQSMPILLSYSFSELWNLEVQLEYQKLKTGFEHFSSTFDGNDNICLLYTSPRPRD